MDKGNFKEGESGWYTALNVAENDFLNSKLESDQYGIYYSVRFDGDAETYLWQAKTAPEEGKAYYGHIEPSKSGKSMRFKKDKVPEGNAPSNASSQKSESSAYLKDLSSMPLDVFKALLPYIDAQALVKRDKAYYGEVMSLVKEVSDELLSYSDNIRNGVEKPVVEPQKTVQPDPEEYDPFDKESS